jgi:sugar phosphate isomerase/epimerase
MRLGGPVFGDCHDPGKWIEAVRRSGFTAAYCPVGTAATDEEIAAYAEAARDADVVIAEVGAWSNPLSPDEETRRTAFNHCCAHLDLADRIGARCCVNIAGSCAEQWDGPHPANLTPETCDRIVACVRSIIDTVKPARTFYALETMPWMYPDSAESYERLIRAIDRERFGVHLDPVNLICSPRHYYATGDVIRDCFARLGPHIRSCHAKDVTLAGKLTVHLDEVRPGLGGLDYGAYLRGLSRLPDDVPLMLEHLPSEEEYTLAAAHVRRVADEEGLPLR